MMHNICYASVFPDAFLLFIKIHSAFFRVVQNRTIASQYKQKIRQTVDIDEYIIVYIRLFAKCDNTTFASAADGTGDMALCTHLMSI